MAVASLDHAQVVAYALEHGTSAAARRFRVSDSYIRRLKRSSAPVDSYARRGLHVVERPSVPVSVVSSLQLSPAHIVASRGSMWRCPACRELVRVPAGTRWNDWIKREKCLHGVKLAPVAPVVMSGASSLTSADVVPEYDVASMATQSSSPAVPVPVRSSAAAISPASSRSQISSAPASGPQLVGVMRFLLPWLAEYWRVPLAVALGLVLVWLCHIGVR